ncbi:Uncharacterised protein [Mycobacteroides abscessus]|nr:Uncharacterised protein [Mycobacteroides abscessus]
MGDRPRRDAADPRAEQPARPHRRAGRRADEDRARRRRGRAARGRGVRLRDRADGRLGLRHDARVPPGHVPGGRRDAEPGAAGPLHGQAGVRRELLRVHRGGGARVPGAPRVPEHRGGDRPRRVPRHAPGDRPLEGAGSRPRAHPREARPRRGRVAAEHDDAGPRPREGARQPARRAGRGRAGAA